MFIKYETLWYVQSIKPSIVLTQRFGAKVGDGFNGWIDSVGDGCNCFNIIGWEQIGCRITEF